jgi:hypothetical protein
VVAFPCTGFPGDLLPGKKGHDADRGIRLDRKSRPRDRAPGARARACGDGIRTQSGAYAEIVRIAEAVRASRLDWTLVRVPLLNEKPQTKSVRVGYLGQGTVKTAISRSDLAWFMLEQVKRDDHVRKAPAISN